MAGVAARELLQQLASGPLAGAALQQLTVADLKKLCWSYAYAEVEPGAPHAAWEAHYMGLTPKHFGSGGVGKRKVCAAETPSESSAAACDVLVLTRCHCLLPFAQGGRC